MQPTFKNVTSKNYDVRNFWCNGTEIASNDRTGYVCINGLILVWKNGALIMSCILHI